MPDFPSLKEKYDPQGMYDKILGFPQQFREGWEIGKSADLPSIDIKSIKNIVVCGLGGSAIGGDLVRSFLTYKISVPFYVCRHYLIPEFVDQFTLCIISSYSGNTEETLAAYDEAKKRGALILAITSNGKLKQMATADGYKVITIPPGFPPRAALGYSFVPMLTALSRMGFFEDINSDIEAAIAFLEKNVESFAMEKANNPAMQAAEKIHGKIPLIYSGQDYIDAVAVRFKGQICENSKQLAFFNFFPEFNHNELVGWGLMESMKDKLYAVILKDSADHERVSLRMQIVARIIREKGVKVLEFESSGPNLLARIFSLVQFGDFTSLYLALLNKIDPTPVKVIDYLKGELEKL
jgi:glucose/mannose-6-phosphate isomerase